jgi:hypothetical protein
VLKADANKKDAIGVNRTQHRVHGVDGGISRRIQKSSKSLAQK